MKNNVHATLSTAVSSIATTIQLTSWQGARFGNDFPQIATLESFDENWKVTKREIVQITGRTGDNLTVVRAYAPCPENDDANSQSQSAISFNADDTISLYIPKEIFDKIADSIKDLYDNWNDRLFVSNNGWLEIKITGWTVRTGGWYAQYNGWIVSMTDNATNYVMIDWSWTIQIDTTWRDDDFTRIAVVTTSSGVITNIERWKLDTIGWTFGVDIHGLPQKNVTVADDEILIADSEDWFANKKVNIWSIFNSLTITWTCWEDIVKWNSLYIEKSISYWEAIGQQNISDTINNTKIAIKEIWNWTVWNKVKLSLQPTTSSVWDLNIRLETDDNWTPSWNLIDENAFWSVSYSDFWTTNKQDYEITLNWNVSYSWIIRIVLYSTIDASNYWKLWYKKESSKIRKWKIYNWSTWNDLSVQDTKSTGVSNWDFAVSAAPWWLYFTAKKNCILYSFKIHRYNSSWAFSWKLYDWNWMLLATWTASWENYIFNYQLISWNTYRVSAEPTSSTFVTYNTSSSSMPIDLEYISITSAQNPRWNNNVITMIENFVFLWSATPYSKSNIFWKDLFCLSNAWNINTLPYMPMIAKKNWNVGNIISCDYLWISQNNDWLTIWTKYYASDTDWEISTTPWTNSFEIWTAIDTDKIYLKLIS